MELCDTSPPERLRPGGWAVTAGTQAKTTQVINLQSLDGLRGLLAVFVLGHHARWLLWVGFENWMLTPHPTWQKLLAYATVPLRFGHEAVMAFFVLSGFFIHLRASEAMADGREARMSVANFLRRRAHRRVWACLENRVRTLLGRRP